MGDNFTSNQEAMIDFAKFALAKRDDLEPWSSPNGERYHPSPTAFGAVSDSTNDVEYEYWPLTPEEFAKHKGITLDPAYDPGPGIIDSLGTTGTEVAGAVTQFLLQPFGLGLVDSGTPNNEVVKWLDYYTARGPSVGSFVGSHAPSDAPWTSKLHMEWTTAVDNRLFEVDQIRGEIEFVVPLLAIAAEKYAETDLENEVNLDQVITPPPHSI